MAVGSTVRGLLSRMTKSASLPGAIDPLMSSSKFCQAASIVTVRSASSGVIRSSGPSTCSVRVSRFTLTQTSCSGLTGVTGVSSCTVNRMPRSIDDRRALMPAARSGPMKMSRCRSPQ